MTKLLKKLKNIPPQRGMPVDDKGESASIQTAPSETVQLFYWNAGVRTTDAGQVAGVVVEGQLAFNNVKNASGAMEATYLDTSLAFTSTALTTEVEFPWETAEQGDDATGVGRATAITSGLSNGEYCVDYTKGTIYGLKASVTTTLTSTTYKILQGQSGGGGTLPSNVDLTKIGGTDVNLDDAAFAVGVDAVLPTGFLADEAATDSVDEGDTGIARMTLDRRQIMAGQTLDDAAFGVGTEYVQAVGNLVDDTATDSVDEGDIGLPRMSADRVPYVQGAVADDAVDSGNPISIGGIARSGQRAAVAALDRVKATFNLFGEIVIAGYSWSANALRMEETDPLDQHFDPLIINTDTTNETAATHYYPSATGTSLDSYKDFSISGKLIDADETLTLTVEMMNDEDTTSGDWIQVYGYDDKNNVTTNSWAVTNGTLTFANSFNNANYTNVRVKVVAGGATNTVIVKGRAKAL